MSGTEFEERSRLVGGIDQPEPVAQPGERGAGDEDAALEREGVPPPDPPGDGGQQTGARVGHGVAGIDEQERPRPVCVLGHAGLDACLTEQGGLLVAGDTAHRKAHTEEYGGIGHSDPAGARVDLCEDRFGNAEPRAEIVVEPAAREVVEQRPARVAGIRCDDPAPGEPCDEPGVYRPGADLSSRRSSGEFPVLSQQPFQLGRGEVRVEQQPGPSPDLGLLAAGPVLRADPRAPPALPHDGGRERLEGAAIEDHERLALVGEPDRNGRCRGLAQHRIAGFDHRLPELRRILLDPAIPGMTDPHLAVGSGRDAAVG